MPREAKAVWQHRFDLNQAEPEQARLHEHLDDLAKSGKASDWIRQTLCAALPHNKPRPPKIDIPFYAHQTQPAPPEPTYSDDDVETP